MTLQTTLLLGHPYDPRDPCSPLSPDACAAAQARLVQAMEQGQAATAAALAGLHGPFAIGLHDPERGRTLLAVDRLAMHTLCYAVRDGRLEHAERADALGGADLDLQALFDYLYFHCIPSPRTAFSGVSRLTAGHYAWFENGTLTVQPYWEPAYTEPRGPVAFEALKEQFNSILRRAVRRQLDGSRPACFLSGGTDSSSVAGLLTEVTGQPAATYSIGFDAEGYDEMAYARLAARHFGTEHHEYYVTPADLTRSIPEAAAYHDQPFGNSSALPAYYCALKARADGVTRLLAGDGGDELFGGNTRYAKQRVFAWYDKLARPLRSGIVEPLVDTGVLDRIPLLGKGASYSRQARVPMPDRLETYNLLARLDQAAMFTPAFLSRVDVMGPIAQQRKVWARPAGVSFVNRMLAYDWRYTLAENDLPKVRGSTQMAGIDVGYPLLDQELVDFAACLPSSYKLKGMRLRWFFKEALRGFLPNEILTKKKHGFGLPFGVWATRDSALRALAEDSLRGLGERGVVRRDFVATLMHQLLPEHPGYYGELVWILMMLEQWLRQHSPDYRLSD